MNKLTLITVVTFASVSAFASNARWNALQNAEHISDIQRVFQDKPEEVLNYEAATIEFGGDATAPDAEGGFIRKMGDSAWSLYLGRNSTTFAAGTSVLAETLSAGGAPTAADEEAALNAMFQQQNPIQFTYGMKNGDISWGLGLFYVGSDVKSAETFASNAETLDASVKTDISGLLLGATNGVWDAQIRQGLSGKMEIENVANSTIAGVANGSTLEIESKNSTKVSGGYVMDTMYYYGKYTISEGEVTSSIAGANFDSSSSEIVLGAINSMKKDGTDFFYGLSVVISESETEPAAAAKTKTNTTRVPLLVGVESELNSWLTLRGAISQSLGFLSSTKTTGTSNGAVPNDTTTTMGAGFKWGKAMVDVALGTGSTGTFGLDDDGDNFATAAVTYNF